ncbi:MAG: hypothetical protein ACR2OO_05155 [Thermomicrobiales bacterium]
MTIIARWRLRTAALAVATTVLIVGSSFALAATPDLTGPSPAQGTGQVISQGMTAPPDARVAWRLVERDVPVRRDARPSDRLAGAVGFLAPIGTAVFVTDQDTKLRFRLAPGEAEFVPGGSNQTWASLDGNPASVYTLELAASAGIKRVEGGKVVWSGKGFKMAEGDYDVDLLRDVLAKNETSSIAATQYPVMVVATAGSIEVTSDKTGAAPTRLDAGRAGSFGGNLTVRGRTGKPTSFLATVIGASIGGGSVAIPKATATASPKPTETANPTPAAATPKPTKKTPTPTAVAAGNAVIDVTVAICPAGVRPESADLTPCQPADGGFNLTLVKPDGGRLSLGAASERTRSRAIWSGLAAGQYELLIKTIPDGYDTAALDGYVCCTANGGFTLIVPDGATIAGTLYFFLPAPDAAPADAAPTDAGPPPDVPPAGAGPPDVPTPDPAVAPAG